MYIGMKKKNQKKIPLNKDKISVISWVDFESVLFQVFYNGTFVVDGFSRRDDIIQLIRGLIILKISLPMNS